MKTMLRGAILVLGLGSGVAYADNGDGYTATTLFTTIPGEQSTAQAATPRQVTIMIPSGASARAYVAHSTSLFPAAPVSGVH